LVSSAYIERDFMMNKARILLRESLWPSAVVFKPVEKRVNDVQAW
jgi:hypothetical protein